MSYSGHNGSICEGYHVSFSYDINKALDICIKILRSLFFFSAFLLCLYSYALTHTHVSNCKSISTMDPIDNSSTIAVYDFENPINQAEYESEEDCEVPGEISRLLQQEERAIQPHEEPVETVNLGTEEDIKEVKIGANMELSVKQRFIQMLHEYVEIFAWSYEDMSGLDTDIMVHCLPIKKISLQ